MESKLVTIFGGGGFVGRAVAQELFAMGWRVRIAQRDPSSAFAVKSLGNLGQCQLIAADVTKASSVANAVRGADAVVNLVGILKGQFDAVQAEGAHNVATCARAAGVSTFVQVSAIGADTASPSAYGRSKAAGEQAVREIFPNATILRPSIIFGCDDQFTNRFAQLLRAPVVPIIAGATKFQPVFVGDVAKAVAIAINAPGYAGERTLALGGPEVMSLAQINAWLAKATGHSPYFIDLCNAGARLLATMPGVPITHDQLAMLGQDNVVGIARDGLAAFGIRPTPMTLVAPQWLSVYRKNGRFGERAAS